MDAITIGDFPPGDGCPVLELGPPMDLPGRAVLNADGSVTLPLDYPCEIEYRVAGTDQVVKKEQFTELTLRRLTGADVRKIIATKNSTNLALAISSGLGLGKLALLQKFMDASDEAAAGDVVKELLGGDMTGLPDHADETPDGVTLPILRPSAGEDGTIVDHLTFKRLTAVQRRTATEAPSLLDWGVAIATGHTPKQAKSLVDILDGADAMAVSRVILFLCGSGRRTGR